MMSDEQAFVNALTANPADDVCRLAYSDWLEERNEIGKATYLRLVVRAVEQITNGEDLGTTRDGLWPLISTLEEDWRIAVGRRFDVRLEGYPRSSRLEIVRTMTVLLGLPLAQSKTEAESLPNNLTKGCTFETAMLIYSLFLVANQVQHSIVLVDKLNESRHVCWSSTEAYQIMIDAELRYVPASNGDHAVREFTRVVMSIDRNSEIETMDVDGIGIRATFPPVAPVWLINLPMEQIRTRFAEELPGWMDWLNFRVELVSKKG